MSGCDYCDEGLPLWHRREADEYGMEGDQFMPCAKRPVNADHLLLVIAQMIDAGFSRQDVEFVRMMAKGQME